MYVWQSCTEPQKFDIFAMAILCPTTKFNSRQCFRLYGINTKNRDLTFDCGFATMPSVYSCQQMTMFLPLPSLLRTHNGKTSECRSLATDLSMYLSLTGQGL